MEVHRNESINQQENLIASKIEFELCIEPEEIIIRLKEDNVELKKIQKMFTDLSKVSYSKLYKSQDSLVNVFINYDETSKEIRGLAIKNNFQNLKECFDVVKTTVSQMSQRNTDLTKWIDKQIEDNQKSLKLAEDFKKYDQDLKKAQESGSKGTGCCGSGVAPTQAGHFNKEKELINTLEFYEENRSNFYHYFALYWLNSVFYHHSKCLDESNKCFIGFKQTHKEISKEADIDQSIKVWIPKLKLNQNDIEIKEKKDPEDKKRESLDLKNDKTGKTT